MFTYFIIEILSPFNLCLCMYVPIYWPLLYMDNVYNWKMYVMWVLNPVWEVSTFTPLIPEYFSLNSHIYKQQWVLHIAQNNLGS